MNWGASAFPLLVVLFTVSHTVLPSDEADPMTLSVRIAATIESVLMILTISRMRTSKKHTNLSTSTSVHC